MSTPNAQPEQHGQLSSESQPQVIVRAGKTFICSSCGTLVEIPPEFVGQLVLAVEPSPQPQDPQQSDPTDQASSSEVPSSRASTHHADGQKTPGSFSPQVTSTRSEVSAHAGQSHPTETPRPKRPKRPPQPLFAGQTIDGLVVPSASQLDRAFNWVTFHLTVLDRQGSEIKRLQKLLKRPHRKPQCGPRKSHSGAAPATKRKPEPDSQCSSDEKKPSRPKSLRVAARKPGGISRRRVYRSKQVKDRGPPR